jgi:hypothetical protein
MAIVVATMLSNVSGGTSHHGPVTGEEQVAAAAAADQLDIWPPHSPQI